MDPPGGRPTHGLEEAVRLLATGAGTPRVLREVLRVAVRETGAVQALVLACSGEQVAVHGGAVPPCLRAATGEALAKGTVFRRSDPVEGINAGAVPVTLAGRVVGALGVAGPGGRLDPRPLDTAAALVAVCLSHEGVVSVSSAPLETLSALATVEDRRDVTAAALHVLERFTSGPAFVCLYEGGRLRVERYRAIDRDDLGRLVASPSFLDLVARWRNHPNPSPAAIVVDGQGVVCAPLVDGLLGLVVGHEDVPAGLRLLGGVAPHVGAALDRVQHRAELARRHREADGVVQAIPSPVVVLDAAGRFLRVNAAACELFGISWGFDSGRPARGRLGNGQLEGLVLDGEGAGEVEVEIGSPTRTFRATVTRVHDAGSVLVLEDVSARREHEQAQADFASVIGHELRTPLTVAKGFLETVLGRSDRLDAAQRDEFLRTALAQTERLEDLINDLLFISTERPRAGFEECDLLALAQEVVARFSARYPERKIDCIGLGGDPKALAGRRHVTHALRHLVDNALKYSEGPVWIEVSADDATVEVAVVDQGPGIFSGDLERLLQPFEQLDSSSTRHHGGTGLGLFLVRRLVEGLGGRLDCDSRLGRGSRFAVRLPRRPATPPVLGSEDGARANTQEATT